MHFIEGLLRPLTATLRLCSDLLGEHSVSPKAERKALKARTKSGTYVISYPFPAVYLFDHFLTLNTIHKYPESRER